MNHLCRDLAPVSETAWGQIEDEAKSRLSTSLAARKMVDFTGPAGWSHSAANLGRTSTIANPADGVTATQRAVLPLVELRAVFTLSRAELDDAERGAGDLDLDDLAKAAHRIAVAENVAVFGGYGAAGIKGIAEASSNPPIGLGGHFERYPRSVSRAVTVLLQAGIGGPYGLAVNPEGYTGIIETTERGDLLLDHLRQILGGPVVWAPGVEGGVVLSLRGGDFVFDCGQDLSIGYLEHSADAVRLYFEESFTFRVLEPDAGVLLRH